MTNNDVEVLVAVIRDLYEESNDALMKSVNTQMRLMRAVSDLLKRVRMASEPNWEEKAAFYSGRPGPGSAADLTELLRYMAATSGEKADNEFVKDGVGVKDGEKSVALLKRRIKT